MKAENETKRNIKLAVDYGLYTLIACVFVLPIIYMFVSAFKTDAQIVSDMSTVKAFLPTGKLSFDNFVAIVDQV